MNKPSPPPTGVPLRQNVSLPTASLLVSYLGAHQRCWSVGKYLGSMLYFDFGEAITVDTRSGSRVEKGKFVLSVHNCYWRIQRGRRDLLNSDDVASTDLQMLRDLFVGSSIEGLFRPRGRREISATFSNGCRIFFDISNRYEAEPQEIVVKFTRADGLAVDLAEDGQLTVSGEPSRDLHAKAAAPKALAEKPL